MISYDNYDLYLYRYNRNRTYRISTYGRAHLNLVRSRSCSLHRSGAFKGTSGNTDSRIPRSVPDIHPLHAQVL